jgi:hypothetical protein
MVLVLNHDGNFSAHWHVLGAFWHHDLCKVPILLALPLHGRLVGLNLGQHIAGSDLVADALLPGGYVALSAPVRDPSVSISANTSPAAITSPALFFQAAMLPCQHRFRTRRQALGRLTLHLGTQLPPLKRRGGGACSRARRPPEPSSATAMASPARCAVAGRRWLPRTEIPAATPTPLDVDRWGGPAAPACPQPPRELHMQASSPQQLQHPRSQG